MYTNRIFKFACFALSAIILGGCAIGVTRVKLDHDPLARVENKREGTILVEQFKDVRPKAKEYIGNKRNMYGMVLGHIGTEEGVNLTEVLTRYFAEALREAGYTVVIGKGSKAAEDQEKFDAMVEGEILTFWMDLYMAVWHKVGVKVMVKNPEGKILWEATVSGEETNALWIGATGEYEKVIRQAITKALNRAASEFASEPFYRAIKSEKHSTRKELRIEKEVQIQTKPQTKTTPVAKPGNQVPIIPRVNISEVKCNPPVWSIGDSWKFGNEEMKVIRVEENLYITENSSSSDLIAYDKNTLEKTFSIDDKGGRVKITSALPLYFDFPLYVGKKWKKRFSARPSFATRDYDYLIEYKVLRYEDITVSAGTFKAFKIELNHTNYDAKMASGKAYIWYSPEVEFCVKVALDGSSYWRGAQGFELMSFNLKDKEISPQEIKLPPEKVDIPSKSQVPETHKRKVPALVTSSPSTDFIVVTGTSANIRGGAGNEFPIVATVNQGAQLTLLGEYGKWFNVRLENGQEGWINSRFVQE